MSKPIECKKCGKLNRADAAVCWSCGSDIQPKLTPKEAIHEEIKYRHEVLHKRRVRRFWIFTTILIIITFGFVMINSIYGSLRSVPIEAYEASVEIYTYEGETYIDVEVQGINMMQTQLKITSIILSNEDTSLEVSSNKDFTWDTEYAYGIFRARLIITTPVDEFVDYNAVKIKFAYLFFQTDLVVPSENFFINR